MFVYGAFSNYSKVNGVFNAMTALSAAAPAAVAKLGARRAATSTVKSSPAAWATWQLIAVKTGTVGAIAAGGVAAYVHREAIMSGVKSIKNINKDSIAQGYNTSINTLGQGLAYINRGNVGRSFAWLSDHFTFVGALMKQKELARRLDRLAALKGVGVHDFYVSMGENGYWSGGYFVPERTFCAVPEEGQDAAKIFERRVMREQDDEIKAHLNLFRPEKHKGYDDMVESSADLVQKWFLSEEVVIDAGYREEEVDEKFEDKAVEEALVQAEKGEEKGVEKALENADDELPDESPIDIAAAAALVPLPGTDETLIGDVNMEGAEAEHKQTYLQHLFQVAQQAGTGVKGWKMPGVSMPNMSMPQMPNVGSAVSSLGQSVPGVGMFKKKDADDAPAAESEAV